MKINKGNCQKCLLCNEQEPLMDCCTHADIMVVGLSSKIKKYNDEKPLDGRTRSGKLIDEFEDVAKKYDLSLYRTNIVKCAPLDDNKKLRYPNSNEVDFCFDIFAEEVRCISPRIIVLLGDIVRKSVMRNWSVQINKPEETEISFTPFEETEIVAIYHPSYVFRSKERKNNYSKLLEEIIIHTKEKNNYGK